MKNEIVLDDSFRKPFEELRDAVTLSPEELKRRDQIKESLAAVRKQAEELARAATTMDMDDGSATPPPETAPPAPADGAPVASAPVASPTESAEPWPPLSAAPHAAPPPPPPPLPPVPPMAPPVGTFPRSPTPAPLAPGRLGGGQRVTPPISLPSSDRANMTQMLSEEDLQARQEGRAAAAAAPSAGRGAAPRPRGPKKS